MVTEKKQMTPEEELQDLCDFSVTDCVAHVSEFSPGTEYFEPEDAEALIQHLKQTPDLSGVLLDGLTSVHRPGILADRVVFYNRTEEEMFAMLEKVPRHEHVRWIFNELMQVQDEWLGKFRAALPKIQIVYSIDSDDFHSTCERMLRVIVQSAKVKVSTSKKSLEERRSDLQEMLDGLGTLKDSDLQAKLQRFEEKRRKQMADRAKKRVKATDQEIAEVKADIAFLAKLAELETKRKVFKDAKDEKRLEAADRELGEVKRLIGMKEQGLYKALNTMSAEREMLTRVVGKQKERDALDEQIKKCRSDIEVIKGRVERIATKLAELEQEFRNFREPETSPVYQRRVAEHVRKLYKRFYELGKKHDVRIVTKPDLLVFGTMAIDYAHDRGRTWQPMPGRVKRLAEAYHGLMDEYRVNVAKTLEELEAPVRDIDVVIESGHHGVFFARWQRLHLTAEEIRMQHVNTFYTGGSDGVKHVLYLASMPFEPQQNIAKYLDRGKPARTRGGKPIASAHHPVFVRNSKGSVSGMQIIRKHRHGLLSVEPVCYRLFQNKDVLKPFTGVMSQDDSDNHFNSPEMDPLGTLGTTAMMSQLLLSPIELYGQKIHLGSTFTLGDIAEANSKRWKEATKFRRNVMEAVEEIPSRLVGTDTADYEAVLRTAVFWANDMLGGSNENLKLNQRVVRWYLKKKFLILYRDSPARVRDLISALQGNHFANAANDDGITELDLFEEWLLALKSFHMDFPKAGRTPFSIQIQAGGEPRYFQPKMDKPETVVHLGGYSVARQGIIEEYGIGHDGAFRVQKPYRVGLNHEPNAVLNKARNQRADVIKSGHTHESYLAIDKSGDNIGRFIDQKPCTQRVSPTELIYGGIPRTAGVDLCIYSQPGRYWKMTIPMEHMRRIGLAWLRVEAKKAVDAKKSAKKK